MNESQETKERMRGCEGGREKGGEDSELWVQQRRWHARVAVSWTRSGLERSLVAHVDQFVLGRLQDATDSAIDTEACPPRLRSIAEKRSESLSLCWWLRRDRIVVNPFNEQNERIWPDMKEKHCELMECLGWVVDWHASLIKCIVGTCSHQSQQPQLSSSSVSLQRQLSKSLVAGYSKRKCTTRVNKNDEITGNKTV